jgi:hypothetical protein
MHWPMHPSILEMPDLLERSLKPRVATGIPTNAAASFAYLLPGDDTAAFLLQTQGYSWKETRYRLRLPAMYTSC